MSYHLIWWKSLRSIRTVRLRVVGKKVMTLGRYHDVLVVGTGFAGFGFAKSQKPTFSVSAEDREAIFQDLWKEGNGFQFLFGGFNDLGLNEDANKEAMKFIQK